MQTLTTHVYGSQRVASCVGPCPLPCLRLGVFVARLCISQTSWPTSFRGVSCLQPPSCRRVTGIAGVLYSILLCVAPGDSNPSPHICIVTPWSISPAHMQTVIYSVRIRWVLCAHYVQTVKPGLRNKWVWLDLTLGDLSLARSFFRSLSLGFVSLTAPYPALTNRKLFQPLSCLSHL